MKTVKHHHHTRPRKSHNKTKKTHTISCFQGKPVRPFLGRGQVLQENQQGWKVVSIQGTPHERGFAHGYLLYQELKNVVKKFPFIVRNELYVSYKKYLSICQRTIEPIVKSHYPEFYQELQGIADGSTYAGYPITIHVLVAWNAFMSMYEYINNPPNRTKSQKGGAEQTRPGHCSAFIATGKATKDGKIVMAHTTHSDLVSGSLFNIILKIIPEKGNTFCMQTAPGCIASGTDWFISDTGIIGCETTIGGATYRPTFGEGNDPYFCRIRQAMQYGNTLDDYARIMTTKNAGDYPGSWLFGNTKTQEIMLCEIGLNIKNIQRTKNGIFYGMNSAMSQELRSKETDDEDFYDLATSSGARNARLHELLYKTYYGKITTENSQKILSDHYNVIKHQDHMPSSKTICVHTYHDPDSNYPNYPHGCLDGKVVDSTMASNMTFVGRWGPACGTPFHAKKFIHDNPKYHAWESVLPDFPRKDWTRLHF